jgi:hypothetical protein
MSLVDGPKTPYRFLSQTFVGPGFFTYTQGPLSQGIVYFTAIAGLINVGPISVIVDINGVGYAAVGGIGAPGFQNVSANYQTFLPIYAGETITVTFNGNAIDTAAVTVTGWLYSVQAGN